DRDRAGAGVDRAAHGPAERATASLYRKRDVRTAQHVGRGTTGVLRLDDYREGRAVRRVGASVHGRGELRWPGTHGEGRGANARLVRSIVAVLSGEGVGRIRCRRSS